MKVHHWYICGCAALVLGASVLFALLPVAAPAGQLADATQRQAQPTPASSPSEAAQDERFGYLPDQLANQAKEPAELTPTN
jgi:hypothetical protein